MENVIKQLKQFKTDAIYEKKKHYNAAERKRRYYKYISSIQIFLNAITGSALVAVIFGDGSRVSEILALIFAVIATILASVQKIGDFEKQSQGNTKVANMYLRISKKISLILNFIKDGALENGEIVEKAIEINSEISKANEMGSQFSTNRNDYKKARKGIKNGEENYTDDELKIWE
ncbi:MAG: SLATT domain-containing protein [Candidatus Fimousia sp.]